MYGDPVAAPGFSIRKSPYLMPNGRLQLQVNEKKKINAHKFGKIQDNGFLPNFKPNLKRYKTMICTYFCIHSKILCCTKQ